MGKAGSIGSGLGQAYIMYKWSGWSGAVFKSPKPPPDHYVAG